MGQSIPSKVIEPFDGATDENQFMEDILYIHADPNALLDLDFQSLFILIKKVALRSTEILDGVVDPKVTACSQTHPYVHTHTHMHISSRCMLFIFLYAPLLQITPAISIIFCLFFSPISLLPPPQLW